MSTILVNLVNSEKICIDSYILPKVKNFFNNENLQKKFIKYINNIMAFGCKSYILVISYEILAKNENIFKIRILNNHKGIKELDKYLRLKKQNIYNSSLLNSLLNITKKLKNQEIILNKYIVAETQEKITNISDLKQTLYLNYLIRPDILNKN